MAQSKLNFNNPLLRNSEERESINISVPESFTVPEGYKLVKESKSKRLQLLVTPTTAANLKTAAAVEGISLNELCNRIFEEYLKRG